MAQDVLTKAGQATPLRPCGWAASGVWSGGDRKLHAQGCPRRGSCGRGWRRGGRGLSHCLDGGHPGSVYGRHGEIGEGGGSTIGLGRKTQQDLMLGRMWE